jgi:hypothetical protein
MKPVEEMIEEHHKKVKRAVRAKMNKFFKELIAEQENEKKEATKNDHS